MKTSPAGIAIIKKYEGCRLTAYQDVVGKWTVGWGDTGPHVRDGLTITQAEADQMLVDRLAREFEPGVERAIGSAHQPHRAGLPLTQPQFDAMVSLAYNIGVGAFTKSSVARHHVAGQYAEAADAFLMWNKAGGRVLAGLVRRRTEERQLYLAAHAGQSSDNANLPPRSAVDRVKSIQAVLAEGGLYTRAIDGDWGDGSRAALDTLTRQAQAELKP